MNGTGVVRTMVRARSPRQRTARQAQPMAVATGFRLHSIAMNGTMRRLLPVFFALLATVAACSAGKPGAKPGTGRAAKAAPPALPAPGSEDFTRLRTEYGERADFVELCPSNQE